MLKTMLLLTAVLCANAVFAELNLIPMPSDVKVVDGQFELNNEFKIYVADIDEKSYRVANILAEKLRKSTGFEIPVEYSELDFLNDNALTFVKSSRIKNSEAYKLNVTKKNVVVYADNRDGFFYGATTFEQLFDADIKSPTLVADKKWLIPCVEIKDEPRFSWRGMHLDVSRHFFPKKDIIKFIDSLADYKINHFHWHLVDDGGWRLEIKKYPKLTEIGAWRNQSSFDWEKRNKGKISFPLAENPNAEVYGGFYTQDEVREIVQYALERNIVIVPEIEMPGHILPVLAAYPQFGSAADGSYYTRDKMPEGVAADVYKRKTWGFRHQNVVDVGKPEVYEFFKNVLDEVIDLFPSQWIHIGGDEVQKIYWEHSSWVQKLMEEHGLKDQHEVQSHFLKQMGEYLTSKGRKMVGWDEIVDGGIAPNATVMFWRSHERMMTALKNGHEVIMSPIGPCYFDFAYRSNSSEKVYKWDPMPEGLNSEEHEFLIGAQANLWSENMQTWEQVEFMYLPRMMALAETTWIASDKKDLSSFSKRLEKHYRRLEITGSSFRVPTPESRFQSVIFEKNGLVELLPPVNEDWQIRYTTDGSTPKRWSSLYTVPIYVDQNTKVTASYFTKTGSASEIPLVVECVKKGEETGLSLKKGVNYRYFEGNFRSVENMEEKFQKSEGVLDQLSIAGSSRKDNFGFIFNGFVELKEAGIYTFSTASDDGSVLRISGATVVENDGCHSYELKEGMVQLDAGVYPIELRYIEATGGEQLDAWITYPSGKTVSLKHILLIKR